MTPEQDPRDAGQHRLGPHVVGSRIVVRRVLRGETGPSGGPAMTDLLGVCRAWADGRVVVQPDDGPAVAIATADIVSGKPVPPRPSVRLRVPVRDAELHTASLWATVESVPLGEWVLRTDFAPVGRLRRRGNSCLAIGDPGRPVEEAAADIAAFYRGRERPVWAQVVVGSEEEAALLDAGWRAAQPAGEAEFRLASLSRVRRRLPPVSVDVAVAHDGPRAIASLPGARGECALDGDWVGVHAIEVEPAVRRRGLGTAVLAGLLEWGAEQGATTVWLHVETDNPPALHWYDALGLLSHHTCRYLAPTAAGPGPAASLEKSSDPTPRTDENASDAQGEGRVSR